MLNEIVTFLNASAVLPNWVILISWFGMGTVGTINALQKLYGGIIAGLKDDSYILAIGICGGPITLLLSINPRVPIKSGK